MVRSWYTFDTIVMAFIPIGHIIIKATIKTILTKLHFCFKKMYTTSNKSIASTSLLTIATQFRWFPLGKINHLYILSLKAWNLSNIEFEDTSTTLDGLWYDPEAVIHVKYNAALKQI